MMKRKLKMMKIGAVVALTVMAYATTASADVITWGAGVDLFGGGDTEAFVNNNGTGVIALNSTNGDLLNATVNSVTFAGADDVAMAAGITQNGVMFQTSSQPGSNQGALGQGSFTNAEVANLIAGQVFNLNGATATFSGLTEGTMYEIQIFANDSRGSRAEGDFAMFSDGVNDLATSFTNGTAGLAELNNSIDDIVNGSSAAGDNSGDSITGSFTADATGIQSFIIGGSNNNFANAAGGFIDQGSPAAFNAIQLRAVSAVPEPGSLMMIGLGSLALISRRRRS